MTHNSKTDASTSASARVAGRSLSGGLSARSYCGACRYFTEWRSKPMPDEGLCRRNPPQMVERDGPRWPEVDRLHDWCGEHKPAPAGARRA